MFRKVLVANRGEVAVRVIRACNELGIPTVIAHSEADRDSLGVLLADESVCIGPASSDKSYLNIANIVSAAQIAGADAIHPGYGFLAENAYLAEVCQEVGITFIGPKPRSIDAFSDKVSARNLMQAAGVPVVPGVETPLLNVEAALGAARELGFPLMLKAVAGGGGRGMRVARDPDDLARTFPVAQVEAQAHFGNGGLYLERLVERGRHVEIQVAADSFGNVVHLGERECSIQRRHQKMIEESPSPALRPQRRGEMGHIASAGVASTGYENVGTVEFLVDRAGQYYFLEMNTRLQVEHPVTELVTGIDLVEQQLLIAAGQPPTFDPDRPPEPTGHAVELRVYAEDPKRFLPGPGTITAWREPTGDGIRVDSGYSAGDTVTPY